MTDVTSTVTTFATGLLSEELAESLEHVPAEKCLFTEASCDNHLEDQGHSGGWISRQVVVRLIDRIGTQQRHDDGLEHEFEHDTDEQSRRPSCLSSFWAHISDLTPWRVRQLHPRQHQHRTERGHDLTGGDDEHREYAQRPKSAQAVGEAIGRWSVR